MPEHINFTYAPAELPKDSRLAERPDLFNKLAERGLKPVVSLEGEAAFDGESVSVYELGSFDTLGKNSSVPTGEIAVIVNRCNRSLKPERLPSGLVLPPTINEPASRRLFHRKEEVAARVLEPLGLGLPTKLVETAADAESFLEDHANEAWVVKPRHGDFGRNVSKVSRTDVQTYFAGNPDKYGKRIIQPAYDDTHPFPTEMRPYDRASAAGFAQWGGSAFSKELRMYGLHSPAATRTLAVCRVMLNDKNHWFFPDPDTVPAELYEQTKQATIQGAKESDNTPALLVALDFKYASVGDSDPVWIADDMNGLAPYILTHDKHYEVADNLRTMLADQILETAQWQQQQVAA